MYVGREREEEEWERGGGNCREGAGIENKEGEHIEIKNKDRNYRSR